MLAKLIAHGATRELAAARAIAALRSFPVLGVRTNVPFLINVLEHKAFRAGDLHTGFVDEHVAELLDVPAPSDVVIAAAAFARSASTTPRAAGGAAPHPSDDPWASLTGWGR
jgi:acetyl/propionyl-CoA carboxylase alpha subunit